MGKAALGVNQRGGKIEHSFLRAANDGLHIFVRSAGPAVTQSPLDQRR